jgi:hypothetical protein
MRCLYEQRAPDDMKLSDAINQILQRMENDGVNSPLIGRPSHSDPRPLLMI